jgi:hypothetical protein
MRRYASNCLGLKSYLENPGDRRARPQIEARDLVWALLFGHVLRENSYHGVEWLVRSKARRSMEVGHAFGDDALGYFTERLDPEPTRMAIANACRQAKRNKAFDSSRWIGLAVDGTASGRSAASGCRWCCPKVNETGAVLCYHHHLVLAEIVGTGLSLPVDVEPYGENDSEYAAGQRLLERVVKYLGPRFADYVVADAKFATAPFLHTATALGLRVVARLKANLPELYQAALKRFDSQPPQLRFTHGADRIEVWDADDFDPWESLEWTTVRVLRYRQHKPDGTIIEAYWLTNFTASELSSDGLFRIAKSRWEVENQGFNDAKNRYGLEHIAHHEANSVLMNWLLITLALTLERLYRLRYLRRGNHSPHSAVNLVRLLWLTLGSPAQDSG